jgi:Flp pilus assembly protein CpaB
LKRSNRLVLLVGIFLAVVAFVGIAILLSSGTTNRPPDQQGPATTCFKVVAIADVPLGAVIEQTDVETREVPLAQCGTNSITAADRVIGQIARQEVTTGQEVTADVLRGGATAGQCDEVRTPATFRSMAVQVDQVTGVGTVIKPGDFVDALVGFAGDKFPVVTFNPDDQSIAVVSGLNSTSVKLLLQGMQVLCTLLPPVAPDQAQPGDGSVGGSTALTGQQEIVILQVTPQQSEVIKFAQMDGNMSLILRNSGEFFDPVTGEPVPGPADPTTGVTLKVIVDVYNVLPPEVIEAVLPEQATP